MNKLLRQDGGPLFEEVFWNRPVNTARAGNILILGGHGQHFSRTQDLYQQLISHGVGNVGLLLPSSLRKLVGAIEGCLYLPSTPSGSCAIEGVEQAVAAARDFDVVIIADDISSNAETIRFLERFLDGVEATTMTSGVVVKSLLSLKEARKHLDIVVGTPLELSEWAKVEGIPIFSKDANLQKEVPLLEALCSATGTAFVSRSDSHCLAADSAHVSLTPGEPASILDIIAAAAVLLPGHQDKFEVITSGIYAAANGFDIDTK